MRARGIEPPRAEAHRDLNPARLPVPPRPPDGQHRQAVVQVLPTVPNPAYNTYRGTESSGGNVENRGRSDEDGPGRNRTSARRFEPAALSTELRGRSRSVCPTSQRYPVGVEVAVAQLVEPRVVVPVVAGSSPVRHPLRVPRGASGEQGILTAAMRFPWNAFRVSSLVAVAVLAGYLWLDALEDPARISRVFPPEAFSQRGQPNGDLRARREAASRGPAA